jgi:hypothetical protein
MISGLIRFLALLALIPVSFAAFWSTVLLLSPATRSFSFAIWSWGMVFALIGVIALVSRRGNKLLETINARESLQLKAGHANVLGDLGGQFMAFDRAKRKLALCNAHRNSYTIHDFSYLRRWWSERYTQTNAHTRGAFSERLVFQRREAGALVVMEVADENQPVLKFQVASHFSAEQWVSRLTLFVNG